MNLQILYLDIYTYSPLYHQHMKNKNTLQSESNLGSPSLKTNPCRQARDSILAQVGLPYRQQYMQGHQQYTLLLYFSEDGMTAESDSDLMVQSFVLNADETLNEANEELIRRESFE